MCKRMRGRRGGEIGDAGLNARLDRGAYVLLSASVEHWNTDYRRSEYQNVGIPRISELGQSRGRGGEWEAGERGRVRAYRVIIISLSRDRIIRLFGIADKWIDRPLSFYFQKSTNSFLVDSKFKPTLVCTNRLVFPSPLRMTYDNQTQIQ